ncbi:MAG: hypothetical protein IJV40_11165 [Oscillospiraceae bacterium]|nr:hypothetical protein [Oscillospiraceae bacterium]
MSTLEATVSMLEAMPEDARIQVLEFTQALFTSYRPSNPFKPLTVQEVLSDLKVSREQIQNAEGMNMKDALNSMGRQHGFI